MRQASSSSGVAPHMSFSVSGGGLNEIAETGCVGALVEDAANPHVAALADRIGCKVKISLDASKAGWQDYETALVAARPGFQPTRLADDHPSFQPYTSGSTGRPKGWF